MKKILIAIVFITASSLTHAQTDRDKEYYEHWYADYKAAEKFPENDGSWSPGDAERNSDEAGQWDANREAPIKFSIATESGIPVMVVKIAI